MVGIARTNGSIKSKGNLDMTTLGNAIGITRGFTLNGMKNYIILYVAIVFVFMAVRPMLITSDWTSSNEFHACIEMCSALISMIAGVACLTFFISSQSRYFLIIGVGFFVCGSEGLVHGILSFERLFENSDVDLSRFIPGTYVAGRLTLVSMIIAAALLEDRMKTAIIAKREAVMFTTIGVLIGGGLTVLAFLIDLPRFVYPERFISRPLDFVSAMLFLIAFALTINRFLVKKDIFTGMLVASILLSLGGQIYMSFSKQLFDVYFDTAHWANIVSYCMPLLGITIYSLSEMQRSNHEVTERKQAEDALRNSEAFQRTLSEALPDSVFVLDTDGRIQRVNRVNPGHNEEDVVGQRALMFVPPEDRDIFENTFRKALDTGQIQSVETMVDLPEGTRYSLNRMNPVSLAGEEISVVLIATDITERKRVESELQRITKAVESSNEAIGMSDSLGNHFYQNKAFTELFGYSIEEIVAEGGGPALYADTEIARDVFNSIMAGESWASEIEMISKTGRKIYVSLRADAVKDDSGNVIGLVGIHTDITQRMQAQKELEDLTAELIKRNMEQDEIIYVSSHDLRSPVLNIQGFAKELDSSLEGMNDAIRGLDIPDEIRERLDLIMESDMEESLSHIKINSAKMEALLIGLSQVSRAGRQKPEMNNLNMNQLLVSIERGFEHEIAKMKVTVEMGDLPPCKGDYEQLRVVFSNLFDNALKYLDHKKRPGLIKISGWNEDGKAVYCVEDNGIGIRQEYSEKIFEIFHQLNPRNDQGEGLGLTITRRTLGRHGGEIWVESEQGLGSKFFVSLPIEVDEMTGK